MMMMMMMMILLLLLLLLLLSEAHDLEVLNSGSELGFFLSKNFLINWM